LQLLNLISKILFFIELLRQSSDDFHVSGVDDTIAFLHTKEIKL
jgi:hypothetical protein